MSDRNRNDKLPIIIAIIIGIILVAAGGYIMLHDINADSRNSARDLAANPSNIISQDNKLYYFVDRGNDIITIMVQGYATSGSGYRDYYINPLEDGYAYLRSKCKVVSREILPSFEGVVVAYSITVEGTCKLK